MTINLSADIQKDLEPFIVRPYRSKRLKSYYGYMSKDNDSDGYDPNVGDVLRAQGYCFDEAPRSVYKVEKLFAALSTFAPGRIPSPKLDTYVSQGVALARKCFCRPKNEPMLECLPMTFETLCRITSNPGGSPGLTAYGVTKAEAMVRALERGLQTVKREKQPEPCLAFRRTQFNDKTRLVWGFPYSMTFIEGLLAYPLIRKFKGGSTPMAFAMAAGALGTKLRVASYHRKWAYSLDMSQFDATLSAQLIHWAFDIFKTWYRLDAVEPVSGVTVGEIFRLIEDYFIRTTIVMPDGRIYIGKDHGVPSGSYFTQMVDSVVNVIICGAISSRFNLHVSRREIFVLGDDLLFWSNRKVDLATIARYANETFHVKLHGPEKSAIYSFNEALHFLGRDWDNGIPSLAEGEVLKRMAFAERFRKYSEDPKERERQVHMMVLSFASTYYCAWSIAYDVIDGSHRNVRRGCANLDVNTYCYHEGRGDPDHLSGLVRYKRKYHPNSTTGDIPITALQYWL